MNFKRLIDGIKNILPKNKDKLPVESDNNQPLFVDLSPVDCADSDGTYTAALKFAMENYKVKNIALTGPYGAGKTSVIKTFERNASYKFLNISLAAFANPRSEDGISMDIDEGQNHAIERSILQQMIYGVSAKKLPYSRFKRISRPFLPKIKSFIFLVCVTFAINEYFNETLIALIKGKEYLNPWLIFSVLFLSAVIFFLFIGVYKAKHSYSIRKLSLQGGEIELDDASNDSILNRHLDEIIYFFDETDYDMVVIEDLDRFGSTEIFIKLREINKLINDQRRYKNKNFQPIKFLYAIKDDMFSNKERAKFFDFIIPVIPVINSSNSYEKVTERLKNYNFFKNIDSQFLKEVSLYIDDLRLIHNIVNELVVYEKKLTSERLNYTKLLSMIIYKNVYPNDFEMLHHACGAFFEVMQSRRDVAFSAVSKIDKELLELKDKIQNSKNENIESIDELIKVFLFHICRDIQITGIYVNNELIGFDEILKWENFSKLIEVSDVNVHALVSNYNWRKKSIGKSFSQIEKEMLKNTTFIKRKEIIDNKSLKNISELNSRISKLKQEKLHISKLPFHDLVKKFNIPIGSIIEENGIKNINLLAFLIKNGYLDESYYHYISNFHEGRLSKNDRDYLLSIRDFKIPDPLLRIDTPNEVCDDMREDDFESEYSLNVNLVDYLLAAENKKHQKIDSVINFISNNFEKSKAFFAAYWIEGKNINLLTKSLAKKWTGYAYESIYNDYPVEHVASVLAYVDAAFISKEMNDDDVLSDYIAENTGAIFSCNLVDIDNFDFIKSLEVKIKNLSEIKEHEKLLDFVHQNNCYQINFDNIRVVLNKYKNSVGETVFDENSANYSTIREYGSEELNKYVSASLSQYVDSVFLAHENNTHETEKYIKYLINEKELNINQKKSIIDKQAIVFPDYDGIPEYLWEHILLSEKVEFNWRNISICVNSEECGDDSITEIFNRDHIVNILSKEKITESDLGKDPCHNLSWFILRNELVNDHAYKILISCLPYHYEDFPETLSQEKLVLLAENRIVRLNSSSFEFSVENNDLLIHLISKNIDDYFLNKNSYQINDEIKEALVFSDISDVQKKALAKEISFEGVNESERLSEYISDLIVTSDVSPDEFSEEIISHCIVNSESIKKSILILLKSIFFLDKDKVISVLERLPSPYSEIASYGKRPKLDKTKENIDLANQLKTANIIASINDEEEHIRINTFKAPKEE